MKNNKVNESLQMMRKNDQIIMKIIHMKPTDDNEILIMKDNKKLMIILQSKLLKLL